MKPIDVPGFPGYFVDDAGGIWSSSGWRGRAIRRLLYSLDRDGYLIVRMNSPSGRREKRRVHVVVALAFLGPRPRGLPHVRHLDGDSRNCSAANLAYGTALENARDRDRHMRTCTGERNASSKLTALDVAEIRASGGPASAQAIKFGVTRETICLLYTSDAADERSSVDLGGRRIIK